MQSEFLSLHTIKSCHYDKKYLILTLLESYTSSHAQNKTGNTKKVGTYSFCNSFNELRSGIDPDKLLFPSQLQVALYHQLANSYGLDSYCRTD